jgi:hypothetical protein
MWQIMADVPWSFDYTHVGTEDRYSFLLVIPCFVDLIILTCQGLRIITVQKERG